MAYPFSTRVFVADNCTNYKLQFERVYSVPGDIAMLNSTSPDVFNFTSVPYNITWHDSKTGRELSNQSGQILVQGETLWLLNVTLDDEGEYITIVRYGSIRSNRNNIISWNIKYKLCPYVFTYSK